MQAAATQWNMAPGGMPQWHERPMLPAAPQWNTTPPTQWSAGMPAGTAGGMPNTHMPLGHTGNIPYALPGRYSYIILLCLTVLLYLLSSRFNVQSAPGYLWKCVSHMATECSSRTRYIYLSTKMLATFIIQIWFLSIGTGRVQSTIISTPPT